MSSINKKKYVLIGCYVIILTFAVLLCFFFFISRSNADIRMIPEILYSTRYKSEFISVKSITSQQLYEYFRESLFQYLPLLIATICFIILVLSCILLFGIKLLDKKQEHKIAQDLLHVGDEEIQSIEETFPQEYEHINQKLSAYDEDQRRLHSYIAHEQKNLIMLIKGKINSGYDISNDMDEMSRSIDDILALSAHKNSQKSICDLALIAAEEYDSYHAIYDQLYFDFDEEANYTILGREQWLKRALDNLIENAIKYGNQKEIHIYLKQKYHSVLVYVQDHGKGISEKEQDRIFDYAYRIHPQNLDGYGIGLSLVSHVCDLCDGFIRVKSEVNKGSTFILSFPSIKN